MIVSTLLYAVREEWSEQAAQIERDQRRVILVVMLMAAVIGPGVFLVDRLAGTVAWRSFLAEALSLCLYAAVAVWYGLRAPGSRQEVATKLPGAWRVALGVYLIGLAIMGTVDWLTKRGLSSLLVNSSRADDPILFAGVLMLGFIPLFVWVVWRYPTQMRRMRLGLLPGHAARPGLSGSLAVDTETGGSTWRWSKGVGVGLLVGLLIGSHFWLTTRSAGMTLNVKPWPYVAWQLFYELGPQSLPEELFMRGVVFNELYFERGKNFWLAALAACSLELLSLLVKQDYSADLIIIVGVVFYTVVSSVASAWLFRWSRSIVPGYISNVTFGVASMFR